jgi:hypothetical protein
MIVRGGAQRAEEHEAAHARGLGGLDHAPRRDAVELLDRAARLVADRGGQMHDGRHAAQRVAKRRRVGEVAQRDLHAHALGPEAARIAHQAAHRDAFRGQAAQDGGADESGGAGEQQHAPEPTTGSGQRVREEEHAGGDGQQVGHQPGRAGMQPADSAAPTAPDLDMGLSKGWRSHAETVRGTLSRAPLWVPTTGMRARWANCMA